MWSVFKNATHLDDNDAVSQLLESCDENLRKNLTRTLGALVSTHEQTVLRNIKSLAEKTLWLLVCNYNICVRTGTNQSEFSQLVYESLQFQNGICPSASCQISIDYSDIMVRDALMRGLENDEIRLDILSDS